MWYDVMWWDIMWCNVMYCNVMYCNATKGNVVYLYNIWCRKSCFSTAVPDKTWRSTPCANPTSNLTCCIFWCLPPHLDVENQMCAVHFLPEFCEWLLSLECNSFCSNWNEFVKSRTGWVKGRWVDHDWADLGWKIPCTETLANARKLWCFQIL